MNGPFTELYKRVPRAAIQAMDTMAHGAGSPLFATAKGCMNEILSPQRFTGAVPPANRVIEV
jgi:hypothetical protein